jgi:hypothetical protein
LNNFPIATKKRKKDPTLVFGTKHQNHYLFTEAWCTFSWLYKPRTYVSIKSRKETLQQ